MKKSFIFCQLGSREHYSIPRVLHQQQMLTYLITDTWVLPTSSLNLFSKKFYPSLRERFHNELAAASVFSFNSTLFWFEINQKIKKPSEWETILLRNRLFQKKCLQFLHKIESQFSKNLTIFSYSYTALNIFRWAKERGYRTILGQIDPGIYEEKIVQQEYDKYPQYNNLWQPAPSQYWENWQEECDLADRIIVNSHWSSKALQKTNINSDKINIIPLAYKLPKLTKNFQRVYPKHFSNKRPLRVLFLGQIILRKGITKIFEAIKLLRNEPIEFWFVGSLGIHIPQEIRNNSKVKWFGSVSRSKTVTYYQQADIFLFPTLSDGFGLTQLEAQAWQLPVIASTYCGSVVKDKINGLILSDITGEEIANSLLFCLNNPDLLSVFSQESFRIFSNFSLSELGKQLQLLNQN